MTQGNTAPDLETFMDNADDPEERGFEYIASPYWHPEARVRRARAEAAMLMAMDLTGRGINALSPVVYSAVIQERSDFRPPLGWYSFDLNFLAHARGMTILEIPGWKESRGVMIETAYAQGRGIPVKRVAWEEIRPHLNGATATLLENAGGKEHVDGQRE